MNGFSNNGEVKYTQDQQMGEHCINEPIHSDTYPKDDTEVVAMETDSIIYIHISHFSLLSHSPTITCRNVH